MLCGSDLWFQTPKIRDEPTLSKPHFGVWNQRSDPQSICWWRLYCCLGPTQEKKFWKVVTSHRKTLRRICLLRQRYIWFVILQMSENHLAESTTTFSERGKILVKAHLMESFLFAAGNWWYLIRWGYNPSQIQKRREKNWRKVQTHSGEGWNSKIIWWLSNAGQLWS